MEKLSEKLSNLSSGIQTMLGFCKKIGLYAILLLLTLYITLWFEFRPFGMVCAAFLGIFWSQHCATLQLQKSVHFDEAVANLYQQIESLRSGHPAKLWSGLTCALLILALAFYCFPWWLIFATILALIFFVKWKYDIKIIMNQESDTSQETQLDLDVQEFLPELDEINQGFLKEVVEQCGDIISGTDEIKAGGEIKNAAERDEEMYLNMLVPEATSNDFESAEHSTSSNDEIFCPDVVERIPSILNDTQGKSSETSNTSREKHIEFKVSHFNANSSSDSDDNISGGLCFGNDDNDVDSSKKRYKQHLSSMDNRYRPESALRHDLLRVGSLASNVLVDAACKHLMDSSTINQKMQQRSDMIQPTNFNPQNAIFTSISNTIRSIRIPTTSLDKHDDSTDEDVDSDFEILNSEELNNL